MPDAPTPITFLHAEPALDPETMDELVLIWFDVENQTTTITLGSDDAHDLAQQISNALAHFEGADATASDYEDPEEECDEED